ncbi:AMP-binding protein [Pseudidiomarina sp. 1APP75-27a]|uniref:class I adenylate-forming enzyme family protein n=1 Tax=Pseudidiomarina terrestris TaxID=2820060 RepID=UPI002B053AE0|nr:AMP-binding protein [Pseudidiomarina sp. 1APP75-27a]MEA3588334.1 AMP-binding protein [Pseudidiomarina sp. 1APP75-27a]
MTIYQMLARNARKFPACLAVTDDQRELNWQELARQVERTAAWLRQEQGVQAGDRVALVLPNSIAFIVGFFAIQRLDAIAVPINVRLTSPELEYILGDAEAKLVLTCSMTDSALKPLIEQGLAGLWLDDFSVMAGVSVGELDVPLAESDRPALLLYTSGTTGRPKGVLFQHTAIHAVATMIALEMAMTPHSKLLHLMPFTHSAPLNLFLMAGTLVGAAHVVAPTFTPDLLLSLVPKHQVTHFFGAPVAYLLTAQQPTVETADLSSVSHWIYGGAAMSTEQTQLVQKAFGSDQFYCVYGLTEAGPSGTLLLPHEHATKAGSVGQRAAFNTEVRLRTETGQEPATGEPGEVEISGEGMMQCYWNNPDATTAAFTADGWLKTGDVAIRDEDGFYWIKDRKKDIIISGGVNLYPREIEDALAAHPAVIEAAVIGVPHKEWGETVKAFVILRQPLAAPQQELSEFLQERLADYKLPRLYEVMDELPRNANGKVLKHQLG